MQIVVKRYVTMGPNVVAGPGQEMTDGELEAKIASFGVTKTAAKGYVKRLLEAGAIEKAEKEAPKEEPKPQPEPEPNLGAGTAKEA